MLTDHEIESVFGFHPAPGSPSVIQDLHQKVDARATTLTQAADGLDRVSIDTWVGQGADSFDGAIGNLGRDVRTAAGAHSDYASAIYAYVSELETAKTRAQTLAQEALQAHGAHQTALNQASQLTTAPVNESDQAQSDREQSLRDAKGRAESAQSDFDGAVKKARTLQEHMDGVAREAERKIKDAADRAPYHKPGWLQQAWDDVSHAGRAVWHYVSSPEFLHTLSTVLNVVSAVCAFIPGLQEVAIVAAVLSVGVDLLAKLAGGEPISWGDVGLSMAMVVMPGGADARALEEVGEVAWSSRAVGAAARVLDKGATSVTVAHRSQAEELFLGKYQGAGYRNTTGWSPTEVKAYYGSKAGTYHWDDVRDSDSGLLAGHDPNNPDSRMPHLQIHTDREIIRIFWPW